MADPTVHINNIFREDGLEEISVVKESLTTARDSKKHNHDSFLIIDDVVYVFGASLKDAGKKFFAYIKMQETSAQELLNGIR